MPSEEINVDLDTEELHHIHTIITKLSDIANTRISEEYRLECADELARMLFRKPLEVGQAVANFAKEDGTVRPDIVRQRLRQAVKRLGLQGKFTKWAKDFTPREGEIF